MRGHISAAAAYIISLTAVISILYLGGTDKINIIYACIIALFTGFFFFVSDMHYQNGIPEKSQTLKEEKQKQRIKELEHDLRTQKASSDEKRREMQDYYEMWAHQIKTPIAAMDLILQNTEFEHKDECKAELFEVTVYTDMVMNYIRTASGSSDYVISKYDLDEILRNEIRKYSSQFMLKGLTLKYIPCDRSVMTDKKQLAFIAGQLISNALKYTQTGGIIIGPSADGFFIKDSGSGIKSTDIPRIFEKGFTGTNGRNTGASSGIGLYLCDRIAKKLGHTIRAESDGKTGSCFTVGFSNENREIE
jgi:signal transduction histidine kinase